MYDVYCYYDFNTSKFTENRPEYNFMVKKKRRRHLKKKQYVKNIFKETRKNE